MAIRNRGSPPLKVLFIGNSFTARNDLPGLIGQLAGACGKSLHHRNGFDDLRRAFASMNAEKLTPDTLQLLMRHKSYLTTHRYINMFRQVDAAVESLYVPDLSPAKPAISAQG